jgi:hypothetical protein
MLMWTLTAALSIRWMSKPGATPRLLISTGERMQPVILKLYKSFGIATSTYLPSHARGLGNEFRCYANFESPKWSWMEEAASEE